MISIERVARQSDIMNFVARNGSSGKFKVLAKNETAVGSHPIEIERSWLKAKGGSGVGMNELWGSYLASKGYTTGSLKERMQQFMRTGTQA